MRLNESMNTVKDWVTGGTSLGIALLGLFLVVQIIFPGAGIDVVTNLGNVVNQFSGLSGLITLLVFVARKMEEKIRCNRSRSEPVRPLESGGACRTGSR